MGAPKMTNIIAELPHANKGLEEYRSLGAIRDIVVHYDGVDVPPPPYDAPARYKGQANYHIEKDWSAPGGGTIPGFGLMYHYKVDAMGGIWQTQPETLITWHARAANPSGLGVCCDLGPRQQPTKKQLESLAALLIWLCYERPELPAGRANVWGHKEVKTNSTACPGALLPWVQQFRRNEWGIYTPAVMGLPAIPAIPARPAREEARHFPETGFSVEGDFLQRFLEAGGLLRYGYPIGPVRKMDFAGLGQLDVQWFQRGRIERQLDGTFTDGLVGAEALEAYEARMSA